MNRVLGRGAKSAWAIVAIGCLLVPCAVARAQERAEPSDAPGAQQISAAISGAGTGMFLPFTVSARTDSQRGVVRVFGGYDTPRERAQLEALADVTIIGPVALRVGALYGQRQDTFRPTLGLRVQALSQERQGIDLGVGAFYKPEGFTEAEGEVELMLMFARRFDRIATFANIVYGQDPEGRERDGELRLAALYTISTPLLIGLDARLRFDLGSEEEKREEEGGAEYDLVVGPTASYALGPVAVMAQAGLSLYGTEPARVGALAMLGLAGAL